MEFFYNFNDIRLAAQPVEARRPLNFSTPRVFSEQGQLIIFLNFVKRFGLIKELN